MKWPNTLTIIRHGESEFNLKKKDIRGFPVYQKFTRLFNKEFEVAKNDIWPSEELQATARQIWSKIDIGFSDYNIPLTETGRKQAVNTAKKLKKVILLPDVVYFSPYLRTKQTLDCMTEGWPELKKARFVSEERIREQEHGLLTLFNDKKVYFSLNPLQALLFKRTGDYFYRHLNGENKADVRDRIKSFLSTLIRENNSQNVLMISHHLTLLCVRANLERWFPEKFLEVDKKEKPINCGVTIYKGNSKKGKNGKLELYKYNKKLY